MTKKFPKNQIYGLASQLQRAAVSVPANIAEGFDSETNPKFVRFLRYAKRSCTEVQSELYIDQQYITKAEFQDVYDHAGRSRAAIRGFIKYLLVYKQGQQKSKPEPLNPEPLQKQKGDKPVWITIDRCLIWIMHGK